MTTFIYLMMTHPAVQRKAQAEIDEIIGTDRLPNVDDRDRLPYLQAIIKEVNRWGPVAPQGMYLQR